MSNKFIHYGSMLLIASIGLWSGSTAARHFDDNSNQPKNKTEHVKVSLPMLVASISKPGHPPYIIKADYSVSIPTEAQANPALNDMLSEALLKATIQTFTDPSKETLRFPEIAANKIVNLTNDLVENVVIDELFVSELAVYKYIQNISQSNTSEISPKS